MCHLTKKAAEDYIKNNSHRHKGKLQVFVESMHRCPEMIALVNTILDGKLAIAPSTSHKEGK